MPSAIPEGGRGGRNTGILWEGWEGEGGSSWILATLSINATYRDLCSPLEREREREGRVREGAEGMRSPRGVAGTTRRAGPARGSWGALPSTFLSCFTSTLFLTPLPFFSFGLGRKFPQVTSGKEKRLLPSILRILLFENVINRIK